MLLFASTNKCTLPTVQTNARTKHVQMKYFNIELCLQLGTRRVVIELSVISIFIWISLATAYYREVYSLYCTYITPYIPL